MNPVVVGEPTGFSPGEGFYTMRGNDNFRIVVPQAGIGRRSKLENSNNGRTRGCRDAAAGDCRHVFHIPASVRDARTLPQDVGNVAAALNYQVHISEGALEYCNLIYHTLIGSLKDQQNSASPDQPKNTSPDLIAKLEDLQRRVEELSSRVCDIRLSQKDVDQISSKIGIVMSGNVRVPTAQEIASKVKVPSAREITEQIGELSLNEFTKSDLVNRISKFIPASGEAKDIADKIEIPEFKVPTAAEIASQIRVPSASDLASKIKIPSAKEIANQIDYHRIASEVANQMDYNKIAAEVANRINLPDAKSIDISSLAKEIAGQIPKCDPAGFAGNISVNVPPLPSFPTAQEIASQIHLDIPTAQEIANKLTENRDGQVVKQIAKQIAKLVAKQVASQIRVDIPKAEEIAKKLAEIKPDINSSDYSEKLKEIDRKCEDIKEIDRNCKEIKELMAPLQGNDGFLNMAKKIIPKSVHLPK